MVGGGARRTENVDKTQQPETAEYLPSQDKEGCENPGFKPPCDPGGHGWPQVDDERLSSKLGLGTGIRPCFRALGFRGLYEASGFKG